jgi:hypothetical protein
MVEPLREYFVRVAGLKEVGGRPVKLVRGKDRVVLLTAAQATYWLDQGAIGESPGETPLGSALGIKPHEPAAAPRERERAAPPRQRAHVEPAAHAEHAAPRRRKKEAATPDE